MVTTSIIHDARQQKVSLKQRLEAMVSYLEATGRYDFSKAAPVSIMTGAAGRSTPQKLALDGIILAGNAAGPPMFACRWGGSGLMLEASWTGRAVGKIAANAVRKGDVSGKSLEREYRAIFKENINEEEEAHIAEARLLQGQVFNLDPKEHERVVKEIGLELGALHLYAVGALPLEFCREPVKNWLSERKGG